MRTILAPEGLHNFRDVGGTPLADGATVADGVLLRSDALATLTERGRDQLATSGIRVIVDLRTDAERSIDPDPTFTDIPTVALPMLDGALATLAEQVMRAPSRAAAMLTAGSVLANLPSLDELYIGMLRSGGAQFAYLAQLLEHATSGMLLHCSAGKDRTGIAVAVLLDAVGADREAIIDDYAASETNLAPHWAPAMRARVAAMGVPSSRALDTLLVRSPATAMRAALAWLDTTYGGAAAYLRASGVTDVQLDTLRALLRRPAGEPTTGPTTATDTMNATAAPEEAPA